MKSRKVLLGLIVGFAMCLAGTATAQKANFQSNKLVEIGPDNIGGRVTSLVVVRSSESNNSTLYAGAANGGLYTRSDVMSDSWRYLPCFVNGSEVTLPISSLVKVNDSILLVSTGEGVSVGKMGRTFSHRGHGLFLFNLNTEEFSQVSNTVPAANNDDFWAVNDAKAITMQGVTYLFVATSNGLYRWNLNTVNDINSRPTRVFEGAVSSVVLSHQFNRAFFTSANRVFKISDIINAAEPVEITSSCEGFLAPNVSKVLLALAPSDESYLYAMVCYTQGLQGVYLTRNTNSWSLISSSTVTPFSSGVETTVGGAPNVKYTANSVENGAITVSPNDPNMVVIGGSAVWTGKGYVPDAPYQWSASSMNEYSLNAGDYMSYVYSSNSFVHSGINEIVVDSHWDSDNSCQYEAYYFLTDGGIYLSWNNRLVSYDNFNRGLNNVEINNLAVCPDGSIISGARRNACPYIESRSEHNGGANDSTWYDGSGANTNHMANILWKGNGGGVAASQFTQYAPLSRRPIFVSSSYGSIGRAYGDYSNYNNTQTWTSERFFTADMIENGPRDSKIAFWETANNTASNESVSVLIDTLSVIHRNGEVIPITTGMQIKAGDSIVFLDPSHSYYPFWHVFDHNFVVRDEMRQTVHTPYVSRLMAVTVEQGFPNNTNVSFTWLPTDFRKAVATPDESSNINPEERIWSHVYGVNSSLHPGYAISNVAISRDGDCAFVVVDSANTSFIARVHGFNSVDYTATMSQIRDMVNYKIRTRLTTTDTIMVNDSSYLFGRHISSIAVDPRDGKDAIVVTFDGFENEAADVLYINRATSDNYIIANIALPGNVPAYSAMVEKTTGEIYVGTENGVFKTASAADPVWQVYGDFNGVAVTSIYQVTNNNKMIRHIGHDGVDEVEYIFPSTKWANAMYFGTYGRGIFMDTTYVVDHTNEIVTPDVYLDIPTVNANGDNSVRFYPNPAVDNATMELTIGKAGNATLVVYDLNGKVVRNENLGRLAEGSHTRSIDCQGLQHGMYLVNVLVGNQKATAKLIVK